MFSPEQEASFRQIYGVKQSNAPGGANVNLPPNTQSPPSFSFQQAPPPPSYFNVPNSQSPYIMATTAGPQLANSLKFYQTFLKGKPKALGIVLILTAILQVALGIALAFMVGGTSLISGIPFWGAIIYIIAGSLSIAAQPKPNPCLIRGSLSMNILTSIVSAIGLILCCIDLIFLPFFGCHEYEYDYYKECLPFDGTYAVSSILLITNFLLFWVSISISVFGCRSLNHLTEIPQVLVIQNAMTLPVPSPTTSPGFVQISPTAFIQPPPPYTTDLNPGGPTP